MLCEYFGHDTGSGGGNVVKGGDDSDVSTDAGDLDGRSKHHAFEENFTLRRDQQTDSRCTNGVVSHGLLRLGDDLANHGSVRVGWSTRYTSRGGGVPRELEITSRGSN